MGISRLCLHGQVPMFPSTTDIHQDCGWFHQSAHMHSKRQWIGSKTFSLLPVRPSFRDLYSPSGLLLGLLGESKGILQMSSPRMQRRALALSAFSYTLEHIRGPKNTLADTLSRLPTVDNSPEKTPTFEAINLLQNLEYAPTNRHDVRSWTARDPWLPQVKRAVQLR